VSLPWPGLTVARDRSISDDVYESVLQMRLSANLRTLGCNRQRRERKIMRKTAMMERWTNERQTERQRDRETDTQTD
jgi:hypothetical protein